MKKLLLGLGAATAALAPIAAVVACGDKAKTPDKTPAGGTVDKDKKEVWEEVTVSVAGANFSSDHTAMTAMTTATASLLTYLNGGGVVKTLGFTLDGVGTTGNKGTLTLNDPTTLKDADGATTLPTTYLSGKGLTLSAGGLKLTVPETHITAENLNYVIRMLMSNAIANFKYYHHSGTKAVSFVLVTNEELMDTTKFALLHGGGWNFKTGDWTTTAKTTTK